eukprot:6214174-Pleurochrysis_carterae.AAC.3
MIQVRLYCVNGTTEDRRCIPPAAAEERRRALQAAAGTFCGASTATQPPSHVGQATNNALELCDGRSLCSPVATDLEERPLEGVTPKSVECSHLSLSDQLVLRPKHDQLWRAQHRQWSRVVPSAANEAREGHVLLLLFIN